MFLAESFHGCRMMQRMRRRGGGRWEETEDLMKKKRYSIAFPSSYGAVRSSNSHCNSRHLSVQWPISQNWSLNTSDVWRLEVSRLVHSWASSPSAASLHAVAYSRPPHPSASRNGRMISRRLHHSTTASHFLSSPTNHTRGGFYVCLRKRSRRLTQQIFALDGSPVLTVTHTSGRRPPFLGSGQMVDYFTPQWHPNVAMLITLFNYSGPFHFL
jgi:hypothetical protein